MAEVIHLPLGFERLWRELEPAFRQILEEKGADPLQRDAVCLAMKQRLGPLLGPLNVRVNPGEAHKVAVDEAVGQVAVAFQEVMNKLILQVLDLEWQLVKLHATR